MAGNISFSDGEFLHRLLHRVRPSLVLEIGSASGFSTAIICRALAGIAESNGGDSNYRVVSYDIAKDFYADRSKRVGDAAREILDADQLAHIEFRNPQNAADATRGFAADEVPFCFIDACHHHPWPALDLLAVSEIVRPGGLVVLHDINLPFLSAINARPDDEAWGVHWLFSQLDLEKQVSVDPDMISNIGSLRIPHDKMQLRQQLVDIIYSYPWEANVDKEHLARLGLPRKEPLLSKFFNGARRRLRKRQAGTAHQLHGLLSRVGLGMKVGADFESLTRDLNHIEQILEAAVPRKHPWINRMQTVVAIKQGWELIQSDEWANALKVADDFLSKSGDEALVLMRGCALNGLSRYREAEDCLRKYRSTGTQADQYVPVELARAVMHQQRFDEAEQILVESLSHPAAPNYDRRSLMRHETLLRDILAARGDEGKSRAAIEKLKAFMAHGAEK